MPVSAYNGTEVVDLTFQVNCPAGQDLSLCTNTTAKAYYQVINDQVVFADGNVVNNVNPTQVTEAYAFYNVNAVGQYLDLDPTSGAPVPDASLDSKNMQIIIDNATTAADIYMGRTGQPGKPDIAGLVCDQLANGDGGVGATSGNCDFSRIKQYQTSVIITMTATDLRSPSQGTMQPSDPTEIMGPEVLFIRYHLLFIPPDNIIWGLRSAMPVRRFLTIIPDLSMPWPLTVPLTWNLTMFRDANKRRMKMKKLLGFFFLTLLFAAPAFAAITSPVNPVVSSSKYLYIPYQSSANEILVYNTNNSPSTLVATLKVGDSPMGWF